MNRIFTRRRSSVAIATVGVVAVTVLSGCSASTTHAAKEPQTITFGYNQANPTDTSMPKEIAAFVASHKGVKVNLVKLPANTYSTALATRIKGGNAPDAFEDESGTGYPDSIIPFAKAGLLLAIPGAAARTGLPHGAEDQFTYNNKVYGVSLGTNVYGAVYNNQAAAAVGAKLTATSTIGDVTTACKAASANGLALYGVAGSVPENPGLMAISIATSSVYGPDANWDKQRAAGKVKFATTKGWTDALNAVVALNKAGCFQPGAASADFSALTNGITTGKTFGFFVPGGAVAVFEAQSGGKLTLDVLPAPAPAGFKTYLAVSSDIAISGSATTKSPKLVAELLTYFTTESVKNRLSAAQGTIPVNESSTGNLLPQYAPVASLLAAKKYRGFAALDWNAQVYTDLGTGVQGLLTGQATVSQVLQKMDSDWS